MEENVEFIGKDVVVKYVLGLVKHELRGGFPRHQKLKPQCSTISPMRIPSKSQEKIQ